MGEHNSGGKRHLYPDEAKGRRIWALLDGKEIREPGPAIQIIRANPFRDQGKPGVTKLHVRNLSYDVDDDDLRELFADCGSVLEAHLFRDSITGRSRGFACVRLSGQGAAERALAKDGWIWARRNLRIKIWDYAGRK